ncbi:MAG: F0F1 ATP synthase subunit A [Acidimicrobiaceae bacterium]|nr:F0F1 ATP synthase subunit A [Acidimicrobiaceae bacterium]
MGIFAAVNFPPIGEVLNWKPLLFGGSSVALNKVGLTSMLATAITLALFFLAGRKKALVPTGVQNVVESGVDFITNSIVLDIMGPEGIAWLPWLTGLFFFILFNNLFEVVPIFQMPATARMGVTLPLAITVWVTFMAVGVKKQGFASYFKHAVVPSGVPGAILVLLVPLEILSTFIVRPFALAIRLFGNMLAGHLLLLTFAILSEAMFAKSIALVLLPLPFAMLTVLTGYEIFVSALQAFIFTILTAVYIGEAMAGGH